MSQIAGSKVQLRGLNGNYNGIDYDVEGDEFLIGRHFDSQLILKENTISGKHAKLTKKGNYYEIEDMGSTNGTFVNKKKIIKQKLRTEDVISFDKIDFRFINPADVGRTIISTDEGPIPPDQTIIRPEAQKESGHEEEKSETAKLKELIKQHKGTKKRGTRSGLMPGLFLSLMMAFTINIGFAFLIGIIKLPVFSLNNIGNSFKGFLAGFPIPHTHTYWTVPINIDLIYILIGVCIPVGLILSGWILQRYSGKSRFRNALVFCFFYTIIIFFLQFSVLNFNYKSWLLINGTFIPGIASIYSVLTLIAYIWGVSFMFSLIGTHLSKNHK